MIIRILSTSVLAIILSLPCAARASSGAFTLGQPLNHFRKRHNATLLLNGKLLVSGGIPLASAAASEVFDPQTQTWTDSGNLIAPRQFHTTTLLADGRVIVVGGQNANQLFSSTELYAPITGVWSNSGSLNQAR